MRNPICLILSAVLALCVARAEAQGPDSSHRPIHDGLESDARPEDALMRRLAGLGDRKRRDGEREQFANNERLRQLAAELLKDEKLRETLRQKFKDVDLRSLQEKIREHQDLARDPELRRLFAEGMKNNRLDPDQQQFLQDWAKKNRIQPDNIGERPIPPDGDLPKPSDPANLPINPPQPGREQQDGNQLSGRWEKEASQWLNQNGEGLMRNLDRWVGSASGKAVSNAVKRFGERLTESRAVNSLNLEQGADRAAQIAPRIADLLPGSAPRMPSAGSLPSPGSLPSMPAVPNAPEEGGKLLFVLLFLGVLALLGWRLFDRYVAAREGRGWNVGPWPVPPDQVSTKGDLVRAFEHLALLLIGPSARPRNHLDLAEQMSSPTQPRRDAANELARLYEQARYDPATEPLAPVDLARARRDLQFLAGGAR